MVTVQTVVVVIAVAVVVGGLQCSKKSKCIVEYIVSGTMHHEMYCVMTKAYHFTPT